MNKRDFCIWRRVEREMAEEIRKNRIQVSNSKKSLFFYVNLSKVFFFSLPPFSWLLFNLFPIWVYKRRKSIAWVSELWIQVLIYVTSLSLWVAAENFENCCGHDSDCDRVTERTEAGKKILLNLLYLSLWFLTEISYESAVGIGWLKATILYL